MNTLLKRGLLVLAAFALIALAGPGCQTTKGFGRDVENLGEKIQGE